MICGTIDEKNKIIDQIRTQTVTTLSNPGDFDKVKNWPSQSNYQQESVLLDEYFPHVLTNIIINYMDWSCFGGVALYAVPLSYIQDWYPIGTEVIDCIYHDIIFFGRLDKGAFEIMIFNNILSNVSGHFPLDVRLLPYQHIKIMYAFDDPFVLVGLSYKCLFDENDPFLFVWKNGNCRIPHNTETSDDIGDKECQFIVRGGLIGRKFCP